MKKLFLIISIVIFISACNRPAANTQILQNNIDSLNKKIANTYKPGFGEFMSSIQAHHSKLWFAGQNKNWKLADFEIHEIIEAVDDIREFQKERKESESIDVINPILDSVNSAIQQKNPVKFRNSFTLLTNTCNSCHKAVDFEFIQVKIPETSPFSNQEFKINQ